MAALNQSNEQLILFQYQLNELKSSCEQYLINNLTTESVAQVFLLADLHQATELKSKATHYIAGHMKEVKATEGWKVLATKSDPLIELLASLADKGAFTNDVRRTLDYLTPSLPPRQ